MIYTDDGPMIYTILWTCHDSDQDIVYTEDWLLNEWMNEWINEQTEGQTNENSWFSMLWVFFKNW